MRLAALKCLVVSLTLCLAPANLWASDTSYEHYSLKGLDALGIVESMTRSGPKVNRNKALASLTTRFSFKGEYVQEGSQCRLEGYKVIPNFKITLPEVRERARLDGETRTLWDRFYNHAKWHEEEHRRIWMGCIAKTERQVDALRAPTCPRLKADYEKLYAANFEACKAIHAAFDEKETRNFYRHGLVVQAMGQVRKEEAARQRRIEEAPTMPDWFFETD